MEVGLGGGEVGGFGLGVVVEGERELGLEWDVVGRRRVADVMRWGGEMRFCENLEWVGDRRLRS
jgi:hypothetical protein